MLWPTWVGLALSDPGDGDAATLGVTEAEQEGAVLPLVQALLGLDLADEANDGAGNIIMTQVIIIIKNNGEFVDRFCFVFLLFCFSQLKAFYPYQTVQCVLCCVVVCVCACACVSVCVCA